ncbi:MAG: tRNA uridine-5-carboxymethylaminomethyl(34) synthesis GTPase MnmE [Tidjanibacter sp.]|nr:tRNA uridine-5-carboxymethylaminomethyl(34) synthesis GTPase MnmE [Tidjanibacter sp.]
MIINDTIVAPATPTGGAIAIVRIEGGRAIAICQELFRSSRGPLADLKGYSATYGVIYDGDRRIDDVIVTLFREPHSYTGGDMVEIACHGSAYIVGEIVRLAIEKGARAASAGEFTKRAFLAGKIDLSQAEAVADIIAADSMASLTMADTQLRGAYSDALSRLRGELLRLAALLELELDFSEEDVEFADRGELTTILETIDQHITSLSSSFKTGNAIKRGVAVAIVGEPNVGKSTLLNRIVGEERAMVSDIAGTTRDSIEESVVIDGVRFRFIDTAGLHQTDDRLENMGIERTHKAIEQAQIIVEMFEQKSEDFVTLKEGQHIVRVINKCDIEGTVIPEGWVGISAKYDRGIEGLLGAIRGCVDTNDLLRGEAVVSNSRHYEALIRAHQALMRATDALTAGISTDLVAQDIREVLAIIGEITGEVTSTDILSEIFSKFCIGK